MKDSAVSEVPCSLGADWLEEQYAYVIQRLQTILRNPASCEEKKIAADMLAFYQSERTADCGESFYQAENLLPEILPGFIPVREAFNAKISPTERSS